jgi:hypothetical protein
VKKLLLLIFTLTLFFTVFLLTGCYLEPDTEGLSADGIVLYSGREILNDKEWEIVVGRVQQLRATSTSGHKILWHSSDVNVIEVSDTGRLRVGTSPNKTVVITVSSAEDPSINTRVTFRTKALR